MEKKAKQKSLKELRKEDPLLDLDLKEIEIFIDLGLTMELSPKGIAKMAEKAVAIVVKVILEENKENQDPNQLSGLDKEMDAWIKTSEMVEEFLSSIIGESSSDSSE